MAKISDTDKKNMIEAFEMAQSIELSAAELYQKIAADPEIKDQNIITTFKTLTKDEQRHAEIVQEIIDLIERTL